MQQDAPHRDKRIKRGFHDLFIQQPSSLFVLFQCSSVTSLTVQSVSVFGGEDVDVLELVGVPRAVDVPCHTWLVCHFQRKVLCVFTTVETLRLIILIVLSAYRF
jgi:hypothetical protein